MEPEGSLLHIPLPATCPYSEFYICYCLYSHNGPDASDDDRDMWILKYIYAYRIGIVVRCSWLPDLTVWNMCVILAVIITIGCDTKNNNWKIIGLRFIL
jgi:hypothetical protein